VAWPEDPAAAAAAPKRASTSSSWASGSSRGNVEQGGGASRGANSGWPLSGAGTSQRGASGGGALSERPALEAPDSSTRHFVATSLDSSPLEACGRAAVVHAADENTSHDEVFAAHGDFEEVFALSEDSRPLPPAAAKRKTERRQSLGFPPLSPGESMKEEVLDLLLHSVWAELVPLLSPLLPLQRPPPTPAASPEILVVKQRTPASSYSGSHATSPSTSIDSPRQENGLDRSRSPSPSPVHSDVEGPTDGVESETETPPAALMPESVMPVYPPQASGLRLQVAGSVKVQVARSVAGSRARTPTKAMARNISRGPVARGGRAEHSVNPPRKTGVGWKAPRRQGGGAGAIQKVDTSIQRGSSGGGSEASSSWSGTHGGGGGHGGIAGGSRPPGLPAAAGNKTAGGTRQRLGEMRQRRAVSGAPQLVSGGRRLMPSPIDVAATPHYKRTVKPPAGGGSSGETFAAGHLEEGHMGVMSGGIAATSGPGRLTPAHGHSSVRRGHQRSRQVNHLGDQNGRLLK
ncbi:hypothetical protein CYMTET_41791, partial [Cymbomonas tetramitiformis]